MKKAGRALCKYARIDEHTPSLHFVIPCWEQLRKPYCKSRLAGIAFRFNLNHSEVIQKGFFHFVQHVATSFLRISKKGWAWDWSGKPRDGDASQNTLWIPPADHWREVPCLAGKSCKVQPEAQYFQRKASYQIHWSQPGPLWPVQLWWILAFYAIMLFSF